MPAPSQKRRPARPEQKRPVRRPPRMAEIRRTRQRVLLFLYMVLGVEAAFALLTSPVFSIKHTAIKGTEGLPAAEASAVTSAVTLKPGINWFLTPVDRLQKNLATLPWIRSAKVSRHLPDRLDMQILQREPIVIVEAGARTFEVDAQGTPIRAARPEVENRLEHIVLEGHPEAQPGFPLSSQGVLTAIQIFRTLGSDPMVRIAKIQVDQNDNLCLNMRNGIRFLFGRNEKIETKIDLMRRALKSEPELAARVAEVNLSCPEAPACTPRIVQTPPSGGSGAASTPGGAMDPGTAPPGEHKDHVPGATIL